MSRRERTDTGRGRPWLAREATTDLVTGAATVAVTGVATDAGPDVVTGVVERGSG